MLERWYCIVNHRSRSADVITDPPLYSANAWAITTVFLRSIVVPERPAGTSGGVP